jgi:hypothetical protein
MQTSWIEVSWSIITLAGLYPAFMNYRTQRAEAKLVESDDGPAKFVGQAWLWVEGLVLTGVVAAVLVGVLAIFQEPVIRQGSGTQEIDSLYELFLILLLLYVGCMLSARSWLVFYTRRHLAEYAVALAKKKEESE